MKYQPIWKKIAVCLLLFNLIIPAFTTQAASSSLELGPGSRLFDGGSLSFLSDYDNRQMLSMILEDKNGSIVVIDGGWDIDAAHLTKVLKARGGHVSGWFLTHPHSDHVGALVKILNTPDSPITIDNIYYSMGNLSWYERVEPSRADMVKKLKTALAAFPKEKQHTIVKGQEMQFGEIKAKVLNNPYFLDVTSVNNSSMVYKFFLNDVSILVLGDMGPEGGQLLLKDCTQADLKSDIVQMAHHGQSGVNRQVYQVIKPKIALWPCPLWLWNNDSGGGIGSGDWSTLETRKWMRELGVRIHYCIKDGDQIIY